MVERGPSRPVSFFWPDAALFRFHPARTLPYPAPPRRFGTPARKPPHSTPHKSPHTFQNLTRPTPPPRYRTPPGITFGTMPRIRIYFATMQPLVPDIEENLALPANAAEALPDLTPSQELDMRVRTIKLLSDISGQPLIPDQQDADKATELARQMIEDPKARPDFGIYPNETVAFLAGIIKQANFMLVNDLSELKLFVVNNLVKEYATASDAKTRVNILTKIGEVDGVDAFKKRTEMTVKIKTLEEVDRELTSLLEGVEYHVIDDSGAKNAQ